jgi:putative peptidoglycan lipid II flippase
MLNMAMIAAMLVGLYCLPSVRTRVLLLAAAVTAGGVAQLILQVPLLVRIGLRPWRRAAFGHPGLKAMRRMALPAVFGSSVYQINLVLTTLLATLLPEGSVTYLYLADRLVQLPLGLFGVSAATALLPELASNAADADMQRFRETYQRALQVVLTVALPATVGLAVLREPIVDCLFRRGAFGVLAAQATSAALLYYAIGLWALVVLRVAGTGYFALQQTRIPVRAGIAAVGVNLVCGVGLMLPMGPSGLALALSLAALVNLAGLALGLRGDPAAPRWRPLGLSVCKIGLCSAIMGLILKLAVGIWMPDASAPLAKKAAGVLAGVLTGLVVYGVAARVLMPAELDSVWAGMRKRTGTQ